MDLRPGYVSRLQFLEKKRGKWWDISFLVSTRSSWPRSSGGATSSWTSFRHGLGRGRERKGGESIMIILRALWIGLVVAAAILVGKELAVYETAGVKINHWPEESDGHDAGAYPAPEPDEEERLAAGLWDFAQHWASREAAGTTRPRGVFRPWAEVLLADRGELHGWVLRLPRAPPLLDPSGEAGARPDESQGVTAGLAHSSTGISREIPAQTDSVTVSLSHINCEAVLPLQAVLRSRNQFGSWILSRRIVGRVFCWRN